MWTALEIIFLVLGLLLVFVGDKLALPILVHAGIVCLGLALIVVGCQAMITQRLVLRRRGYRYQEAYTGMPAIFQGIQFNFAGLFLIGMAFMMYLNNRQEILLQIAQRPGPLFVLLGGLSLLQAITIYWGRGETGERSRGLLVLELVVGRLFPGTIWLVLGLALIALGLFDTFFPIRFDEMGGRFLEELYRVR